METANTHLQPPAKPHFPKAAGVQELSTRTAAAAVTPGTEIPVNHFKCFEQSSNKVT